MRTRTKDYCLAVASAAVLWAASSLMPLGDALAAPSGKPLPTMCWVRAATGHECPTCGMSRSFVAFFHGDLDHAFRFHPMGPVLASGTVLVLLAVVAFAIGRREPLWGRPVFVRAVSIVALSAVVAGAIRMIVGGLA